MQLLLHLNLLLRQIMSDGFAGASCTTHNVLCCSEELQLIRDSTVVDDKDVQTLFSYRL